MIYNALAISFLKSFKNNYQPGQNPASNNQSNQPSHSRDAQYRDYKKPVNEIIQNLPINLKQRINNRQIDYKAS